MAGNKVWRKERGLAKIPFTSAARAGQRGVAPWMFCSPTWVFSLFTMRRSPSAVAQFTGAGWSANCRPKIALIPIERGKSKNSPETRICEGECCVAELLTVPIFFPVVDFE